MTYKWEGKTVSESLGWEGPKLNEDSAYTIHHELKQNRKNGVHPFTLKERDGLRTVERKAVEERDRREELKNISFGEAFDNYLVCSKEKKQNPRSWKREEQLTRIHILPVFGKTPISKIAQVPHLQTLQKNMVALGSSPRTIRYALHVVRIVFNYAIDEGLFSGENPAREKRKNQVSGKTIGVIYPQEDNTKNRYLTRQEAECLLSELALRSQEVHDMAFLSLYTGMRFGEVASLKWSDVDLFQGLIMLRNTKSGKNRPAYMNPGVQKMFARRGPGAPEELVFPARRTDNKPHYMISHIYYDTVKKMFNQGITDKKKWVNFHTLRHTFASWLVENGTDIYLVKDLLGHHDLKMTERYAHIGENQLKQAVMKLQSK
jgi:integrase